MGVSTRGVKFKFSKGEKVLCYEPDQTKAKVLYESKVLELNVSHDDKGRKVAEYLIHFCGWNSSWDRCVREEFILSYTEENKELQTKLAKEADLTIQGKQRKSKLIKEEAKKHENLNSPRPESPESSSDRESPERELEKEVTINIPENLKKQLEEDWWNVTKKNKLVKLPCQPNVVAILEAFVKQLAAKLLCVSPPRNSKNGKQHMPDDVQNRLNLCKEAMDGIRIYFDFTLPHILLYHQEKRQYDTDATTCSPVNCSSIDLLEKMPNEKFPEELSLKEELSVNVDAAFDCPSPPVTHNRQKVKPHLRNGRIPTSAHLEKKKLKLQNASVQKKITRGRPRTLHTRMRRSIEKHKQAFNDISMNENPSETKPSLPDTDSKSPASGPAMTLSNTPSVIEGRVTRQSLHHNMAPVSPVSAPPQSSHSAAEKEDLAISQTSRPMNRVDFAFPSSSRVPEIISSASRGSTEEMVYPSTSSDTLLQSFPQSPPLTTNCKTSSNSSSHSTLSNSKMGQEYQLIKNAGLLQEILAWRLLPQYFYREKPASPCLIYGAQHLLRLFVKLPEMISKMQMSNRKLSALVSILEGFLIYMSDQKDIFFLPSAYIDSCDDVNEGNEGPVK